MRIWADIFTNNDVKVGMGIAITGASSTRALDGAGSFSLTTPAVSEASFNLFQLERKVRIYVEQDEQTRFFGGGIIRDRTIDESGGAKLIVTGPDSLDALTRRSVLLRRKYEIQQPSDIVADLITLVPPWSISVAESHYSTSARFDGVSVLKAIISVAEKAGLHIREGDTANTLEMGAFGVDNGIRALNPDTITEEIYNRDDVLLIEKISQKSTTRDVINWIIPLGAGEGDAAITLKYCVNFTPLQIAHDQDGSIMYYMKDDDSIATYGQIEKIVTFKDIVPLSNTGDSRQYTSELLFVAAREWLARNALPLVVYNLSVKKVRSAIRPGDKIRVAYKGIIETEGGSHTYLDVNELFWVLKTTESANESGLSMRLDIATVDRQDKDATQTVVDGLEAIDVRNVSPQTHVVWIEKDRTDVIWGSPSADVHARAAQFYLDIDDGVTDVLQVKIHFKSEPGYTTAGVTTSATWDGDLFAYYTLAPNFPAAVRLFIDGVDVTTEYGGPWGTVSASTFDVELDITDKIRNATPSMYQEHTIVFTCSNASGERSYDPHTTSVGNGQSGGMLRCDIKARLVVKD